MLSGKMICSVERSTGNIDLKWPIFTLTQFTQPTITCSKLTIETLEQDAKHVQS